jgi:hypothetical protein
LRFPAYLITTIAWEILTILSVYVTIWTTTKIKGDNMIKKMWLLNNLKTTVNTLSYSGIIKNYLNSKSDLISYDSIYKKTFINVIGSEIYKQHIKSNLTFCAFCSHLTQSSCHVYCFKCKKNIYEECSSLLPGTFSFTDSYFDSIGDDFLPWLYKTPCTEFERLSPGNYYKHFNSTIKANTVANYEVLEGIFTGISRSQRPCHICASVDIDILNRCPESERQAKDIPCKKIINEISNKYNVIHGMVKYIE